MINTLEYLASLIPDMTWYQGKLAAYISTINHNHYQVKFPLLYQYESVLEPAKYTPPDFNLEWVEENVEPATLDEIFWDIARSYTDEWIDELELNYNVNVHVDGRSGKWLVTDLTEESIMGLTGDDICGIVEELKRIELTVSTGNIWEDIFLSVYYNIYCTEEDDN